MGDDDRAVLARALRQARTVPVIDETIAEVDLDGGPMPLPFAAHDPRAITVGSSSKSHWGGLRTGWIRAPRTALAGLVESRVTSDLGAPVLEQLVLLELMRVAPGLTPQRRDDLRASRDALVAALGVHLPELRFRVPRGGLFLWCELPDGHRRDRRRGGRRAGGRCSSRPARASRCRVAWSAGCACPTCSRPR